MTPKQEKFAQLLAAGELSQSDCYRAAFPGTKMTAKNINEEASRLAKHPDIVARVAELQAPVVEKVQLTFERVLQEVARLALFDPRKLFNPDGSPKSIDELDDDTAACIAGVEVLEQFEGTGKDRVFVGYLKKYRIADKNSALEKAMKHLGLFEKDNRQKADAVSSLLDAISAKSSGGTQLGLPVKE